MNAVEDGHGRMLASGTNAPLYTTSFSSRPKAQAEEKDRHENRLAEALELDRVGRVLEFRDSTILPSKASREYTKYKDHDSKTVWDGTEWVAEASDKSKTGS